MKFKLSTTLLALFSVMMVSVPSHAYLDPNIGSMLIQGTVAGIAVVTVTLRMYWYRLVAFFKGEKVELEEDLLSDLNNPTSNLGSEEHEDTT
jgi:hypothetical protein